MKLQNVRKIKGTADKNGLKDVTCEQGFTDRDCRAMKDTSQTDRDDYLSCSSEHIFCDCYYKVYPSTFSEMPDPAVDIALDWHFAGTVEYFMSLRANMPNRISDLKVRLIDQ